MKKIIKLMVILFAGITLHGCMKKPMACCNFPESGTIAQSISFSSSCSSNASRYKWDFGDGITSTDANPTHTYTAAGTYTVKLMAMSSDETKMTETSKSINIK